MVLSLHSPRVQRLGLKVLVGLLLVAPAVAAVVALAGRRWYPTFDHAIIDLRVRDVFSAHTPLTGLYSRPPWNHPGPLMFWGIAPLSWVSGHAPWATRIGGAIIQGVALIWLAVVTGLNSRRLLLAAGVVTSLTYLASNQWLFREPWNLHIPLPYFLVFLFVTSLAASGHTRQFIGMSVAGTVMVQTHIGYAPLVFAGFVYAGAWTVLDARRSGLAPRRWRGTLVIAAAIWVITWTAPIVDMLVHWPGNIGAISRYFVKGTHPTIGLARATRFMADEFRFVPPWLGGPHRVNPLTSFATPASIGWLLVPMLLIVTAGVALRVSRSSADLRMVGLGVVMMAVGTVAIAGADQPLAYIFQWRAPIAAFMVVGCAWSIVSTLAPRPSRSVRAGIALAAVGVIAVGSIGMTVAVVRRPAGLSTAGEPDLEAMMRIVDRKPRARGVIRVRMMPPAFPSLFDGVVNELDRRGIDVRVDPSLGRVFGHQRVLAASRAVTTWYIAELGSQIPALLARPGAYLVAATTPLALREDRELAAIQARVGAQLERNGRPELRASLDQELAGYQLRAISGLDGHDLVRLGQLNAKVEASHRCRCAIVAMPAQKSARK